MRTQWNDAEDRALDYLPHLDQVIYLRGIRRRMDYATGVAGLSQDGPISYGWLSQLCEVRPRACSTMKPPPRPDKNALRSVFDRLEAAGLIRRVRDHGLKSLVFECLLADRGSSARNMSHPSATHEPPTETNPQYSSIDAAFSNESHPSATQGDETMSHPIQGTGIRDISDNSEQIESDVALRARDARTPKRTRKATTKLDLSILPADLSPDIWQDFLTHRKAMRKPVSTQTVLKSLVDEFGEGRAMGLTPDIMLTEAMKAGWVGVKAEWVRNRLNKNSVAISGGGSHEAHRKSGNQQLGTRTSAQRAEDWAAECWGRVLADSGVD